MDTFIQKRNNMHCNHIIELESFQLSKIGIDGVFLSLNVMTLRIFLCDKEIGFNKDEYVRHHTDTPYARKGAKMA